MRTLLNRLFVLAAVAAFVTLAACGASARERTIAASFTATNAARDGFTTYDSAHQHDIVQAATSLDDGKAKLAAYRKQQTAVIAAFEVAYRAIASAAILTKDPTAIPNLLAAAAQLQAALHAIGVTP